jgi:hypothetical protein
MGNKYLFLSLARRKNQFRTFPLIYTLDKAARKFLPTWNVSKQCTGGKGYRNSATVFKRILF